MSDFIKDCQEEARNGKKWCYDCVNYYTSYFCGYNSKYCRIHGSLDVDQHRYHPDVTADTCKNYKFQGGERWFEKHPSMR